jgi:DNA polymerase-3 subunit epsilon
LINNDRQGDITISQFSSDMLEGVVTEEQGENATVLFLDVETTGLSYDDDKVIQLACRPVVVDKLSGNITRLVRGKVSYNDPGFPISEEITALTGVTNEQVKDQLVDWHWLAKIIEKVDFVVAHNVRFDRHFIKKHMIESGIMMPDTTWACSMTQIDWRKVCTAGKSLETLSAWHGFYYQAHNAGVDVDATIYLLHKSGFMSELLATAKKSQWRVFAVNFPRNKNDILKGRKYRWDPDVRMWWAGFLEKESAESELTWLSENYKIEPQIFEVLPNNLFD